MAGIRAQFSREPISGSRTITLTGTESNSPPEEAGALHLSAASVSSDPGRRVSWEEGVIDNEFLNRKKSKVCCIFHKNRRFDESSSDESSSESENDAENTKRSKSPNAYEKIPKKKNRHQHSSLCKHSSDQKAKEIPFDNSKSIKNF